MVEPLRDQLDAVVVFPSMPEVMRLNKVGSFTMQNLGQSKSVVSDFMKKKKKVREALAKEGGRGCWRCRRCAPAARRAKRLAGDGARRRKSGLWQRLDWGRGESVNPSFAT